jgi:hypothetical protein
MKCERCGWPTSLWQRDLFSGLCDKCQRIEKDMPGVDAQVAVRKALVAHVVNLLNKGVSLETAQSMMTSHGFDQQTASAVIHGAIAKRENKYPKITCPLCGASMAPGMASIRQSVGGATIDVLSVLGGGITAMPGHLYFRKIEGGDEINIDTRRAAQFCSNCETFAIVGRRKGDLQDQ